jgi:hypothetical protein
MKFNRFTLVIAAFPFVLYACGSDDSSVGGVKKDAGTDGKAGTGGTGGTAATGGVGALGGTGGSGLTGGSGGNTGGVAGSGGGVAGSGGGVAGSGGGIAGAAGGGGVAGSATGGTAGVAGSPSGGAAGSDASVGGSAGTPSGGSAGADSGVGGTDGGTTTLGDTCANPFVIGTMPFTNSSTTVGATADYGYSANACLPETSPAGSGAPDQVYSFTPTVSGDYYIQLTSAYDSSLYVATDCANVDTTCIAGDEDICSQCTESVKITAVANTTYYIFVDGWQTSPTTVAGSYTLQVDPVPAPTNDTCANATPITTVPFSQVGDTTNATADYGFGANSCAGVTSATGAGANDLVYSFTPSTTGTYIVNVGTANFDAAVYIATDCSMIDATCLGAADSSGTSGNESRTFTGTAGTTYYIFVDGWQTTPTPSNSGVFSITLSTPPAGDTCGNAIPVTSVPFTDSGNTNAFLNDYGYSTGVCPPETGGWGDGSSDVVYSFTPTVTGEYEITFGGFDSTVYVVTNCGDVDNSCVAGTENGCPVTCDQVLTVTLTAGTTYYIIGDGYSNSGNVTGAYTLDIIKNP